MAPEKIIDIVELPYSKLDRLYKFDLTTGNYVIGAIVQAADYEELKDNNIWRVVTTPNIIKWKVNNDIQFTELINGDLIKDITHI